MSSKAGDTHSVLAFSTCSSRSSSLSTPGSGANPVPFPWGLRSPLACCETELGWGGREGEAFPCPLPIQPYSAGAFGLKRVTY